MEADVVVHPDHERGCTGGPAEREEHSRGGTSPPFQMDRW